MKTTLMKVSSFVFLAAIVLVAEGQVNAGIIFDNGSFTSATPQVNRNYFGPIFTMFEDFVLVSDATLNEIRWGGGEYQNSGISGITSVDLTIYDDVPGTGTVILSTSVAPGASFVGNFDGVARYDYAISGLGLALNAGTTYWFGLSATASGGANWSNTLGTASTIDGLYQSFGSLPGNFEATENGAFQLYGGASPVVPEPASFAIFGTICLIGCGRRRS